MITTDAPVTYDEPIDYGIHQFCQVCQVCVNRCPGRALLAEKVWWRGVEKNKLIYERCRPVMARYDGCAVCMKVCPIQRFGMPAVMEHYVATGEGSAKAHISWKAIRSWREATLDLVSCRSLTGSSSKFPMVAMRSGSSSSSKRN